MNDAMRRHHFMDEMQEKNYLDKIASDLIQMPIPELLEYLLQRKQNNDRIWQEEARMAYSHYFCSRVKFNATAEPKYQSDPISMYPGGARWYRGLHCSPFQPMFISKCNDENWSRYDSLFYIHPELYANAPEA